MKNLTNAKKIIVMVIMVAVMFISTNVFAAEDNSWGNLAITNNTSRSVGNNTATNNTATNNTARNLTSNLSGANSVSTTSSYNSTNLPDTGLGDTLPVIILIGVVGVSAVYAYKKVKDYQNI